MPKHATASPAILKHRLLNLLKRSLHHNLIFVDDCNDASSHFASKHDRQQNNVLQTGKKQNEQ